MKPPQSCKFKLPSRGYPSPVMYLLESEIEQAYQIQEEDVKTDNSETEESANPQSLTEGKHSGKGAEGDDAPILDFEKLFSMESEAAGPETESDAPTPSDEREGANQEALENATAPGAAGGSRSHGSERTSENIPDEPSLTAADNGTDQSSETAEPWKLVNDLVDRIQRREALNRDIQLISERLEAIFSDRKTNSILTPFGAVERLQDANGSIRWRIETISCKL